MTQGHNDTRSQRHEVTITQGHKDTRSQRHMVTMTQSHKDTRSKKMSSWLQTKNITNVARLH